MSSAPPAPVPDDFRPEPGGWLFAWGVWLVLTLVAFGFVLRYRTEVPVWDDSLLVPTLIGAEPATAGWFWEQTNEHRVPLPKLLVLGVGRLAGGDFRVGMLLSVAAMAGLAAALLALSGRLAGGVRATDAVFPILLLHLGHAANFLWSFQIVPLLPTALAGALLWPVAGWPGWPGPGRAAAVGSILAVLPLCGGNGLVFVPPLAAWLVAAGVVEARSGGPQAARRGAMVALSAVPGLMILAAYFVGFRSVPHPPAPGGLADGVRTAVQFAAVGLGTPTGDAWPWSGGLVLGLVVLVLVLSGIAWERRPEERPRVVALVLFGAGVGALAAAVGWGRGWSGDRAGFAGRYVAMATPFWCWVAVAVRVLAPPTLARIVATGLFGLVCLLAWPNAESGFAHAQAKKSRAAALARDIHDGMPPYQVVRHYVPDLHPNPDELGRLLPMLRAARVGPFAELRADPPFREVDVTLRPAELRMVRWDGTTAHVTHVDPQVAFALPEPRHVAGIRIRYSHRNDQGAPARFQLTWKGPGQRGYDDAHRFAFWNLPTGDHRETTIWVDSMVDRFRIQPDNQPCEFRIDGITLLEPAG